MTDKTLLTESNTLTESARGLVDKWSDVLTDKAAPEIQGDYKKAAVAQLLENQAANPSNLVLNEDTPTNVSGGVAKWDPVLISMVRRSAPSMIAFDIAGVQPMSGPTGLAFAIKSRYTNQTGTEALFNESNTAFSGTGTHSQGLFAGVKAATLDSTTTVVVTSTADLATGTLVIGQGIPNGATVASITNATTFILSAAATVTGTANLAFAANFGTGVDTATGEGDIIPEMAISIEKIQVEAKTRALKARYSTELAQDMRAIHRLDAEAELINVLNNEMLSQTNREFLRRLYAQAKLGATDATMPGQFDLVADADGRWSNERFKGMYYQIEKEANRVAVDTRRGKGNIIVASADVVSALSMAKIMDTNALDLSVNSDWTGSLFVGTIGTMKVYVDPYAPHDFFMVAYKGQGAWDAGYFYCPYTPFVLARGQDQDSLQPIIAFKSRAGYVANPFFNGGNRTNGYYRIASVKGL